MKKKEKKESEKLERAAVIAMRTEVRKKATLSFLNEFGKNNKQWLQCLADECKAQNAWGLTIFSLVDFYSDPKDKEVAMVCCLLLSENEHILKQHEAMYQILGKNPFETLIVNRGFTDLSSGESQNVRLPGTFKFNWHIAKLLSRYSEIIEEYGSVESCINELLDSHRFFSPYTALVNLFPCQQPQYKLNLLLLIMAGRDGMGLGMWNFPDETLICPENKSLIEFVELWFPDFYRCGLTFDKAVNSIGLNSQLDLFYAYLGFKALKAVNYDEVLRYTRLYLKRYNDRNSDDLYKLKNLQPRIFFKTE